MCHGDDIVFVGKRRWLEEANKGLEKRYGIKTKWIGPRKKDSRSGQVLGRVITYSEKGIKYEADPRHAEIIVEMLNLTNTKPVGSPGWKEEPDEGELLEGEERTAYRALSARVNYLAQDRPDIQFAGKEICRFMQSPKSSDWMKLKKLGRYLRGKMRLVYHFQWQGKPPTLTGYTDTNWAGCSRTRRSTSAGV